MLYHLGLQKVGLQKFKLPKCVRASVPPRSDQLIGGGSGCDQVPTSCRPVDAEVFSFGPFWGPHLDPFLDPFVNHSVVQNARALRNL